MKQLKFIKITILTLLLSSFLLSCEDVVDVDINPVDLDLITVEAYINTRSVNNIYVKLEKSLPVDVANANPAINDALVQISDDAPTPHTITLQEDGQTGMYWIPQNETYTAVPGRTYKLSITTTDGTLITAEDYLAEVENLDEVKVNLSPRGDYEYLGVFINSQETPGLGNYYKWNIYINNRLLYESDKLAFASDELVDGNYIYDFEIFTDWYEDEEDKILLPGDTIRVEQLSISRTSYDFYLGMMNQAFSGGPFSVPPANVPNNLSASDGKRVLGLFSARDISVGNIIILDDDNYTPLASNYNLNQ
ncbi:DUF4249 domain-containing protein [uncultured Draconibacterium sp.]|uniref:DUF4249 domain-containing protein n=1 Tax=uncultured Draconibacterium sp. TaxID=1573823 RepID=UPI0032173C63